MTHEESRLKNIIAHLTGRQASELPQRVLDAIKAQQEASEVLIGWLQLSVVCILGSLYLIAPKTFSEDAPFAPVPWVLSVYLLFTLTRLTLAYRHRLPTWFLFISVVMDMALLMGLIWSFHIQYQQPASFYLKAPTLLYVFIFIALRTLHFDVRFVTLAGIVAALGWLLMLGYAVAVDPSDMMITRDYVEYLTSNSILLGAEFDKAITILMVTAILAVAIARAKRLLEDSVADSIAAKELSRFVPTQVANQVTAADEEAHAGQGEVREATILFTDIENFTSISEGLSPEQLIKILNEYFSAVAEPIEQFGGVINQFQGDAILATFNVPEPDPDHAANAIRASLGIQRQLADRLFGSRYKLRTRIGVNSGVVVGGLVGTSDRLGYTVHGDDVNLASRLEHLNKEYGTRIIASENTVNLAGAEEFRFRRIGEVQVRGRSRPTAIFTLEPENQRTVG